MKTSTFIEMGSTLSLTIDGGSLEVRAGATDAFLSLWLDCDDASESRNNLTGFIRAKEASLNNVMRTGGFSVLDYNLGEFNLSEYDCRVTIPAVLLWLHGRDFNDEVNRLHNLYSETAPEVELTGITLPHPWRPIQAV